MRLFDYIYENLVKDALNLDEPEVGGSYSDDYVKKMVDKLKSAISQAEKDSYVDDDAKEAVMSDLHDKLDAWENVDKETKPAPPPPPEDDGEGEEEQDQADDEREEDQEKEKEDREKERDKEQEDREKERDKEKEEDEDEKEKKKNEDSRLIKSRIERLL